MIYFFNLSGIWIVFRIEDYIYSFRVYWIGWFFWDDEYVVDK